MTDTPVELIVAAFKDEGAANAALNELKQAQKEKLIKIENAAVLRKDEKGKLHIKETADMGGGKGAAIGGVAGAAIGLIAGPLLIVPAAVGALVGGLAAKLIDSGFSDERLKMLGEGLKPGSSAIVAVVEHRWVADVEKAMKEAGADALTQALSADIADQLEKEHNVAYSALSSEEGFSATRVAAGEDEIEGGTIQITDDSVTGSRFLATKDGIAVVAAEADDQGVTYGALAVPAPEESTAEGDPPEEGKPD